MNQLRHLEPLAQNLICVTQILLYLTLPLLKTVVALLVEMKSILQKLLISASTQPAQDGAMGRFQTRLS